MVSTKVCGTCRIGSNPIRHPKRLIKKYMLRISWIKIGSTYRRMEGDITNMEQLPIGVYEVGIDISGWFLTKTADKFVFNYKIYDLQRGFIDHVKKTYNNTSGNLGVLFNGTRGTGKTVSAKVLANELNLPVILVKSMGNDNDGLISYLSSFNFDCIFFFDEFEKQFNEGDHSILQIMDGVYNSEFRKVFLLTTNELNINPNLLSRPSRIRYVREFGNLNKEVVEEYLNDNLKDNAGREDLLSYIDTLTISTIDILKAIVEEVNIHGVESFLETKKFFNVQIASYVYHGYMGTIHLEDARELGYDVDMFLKELDSYNKRFELKDKYYANLQAARTQEEKDAITAEFNEINKRRASFDYFRSDYEDTCWDKLKVNKDTFDYNKVINVDVNKHVVVTYNNNYIYFYYINNPDQKPSLYNSNSSIQYESLKLL